MTGEASDSNNSRRDVSHRAPGPDPGSDPSDYGSQGTGGETWTGEQRHEFGRDADSQLRRGPNPDHSPADVAALIRDYPRLVGGVVPPGAAVLVVGSEPPADAAATELRAAGLDPVRRPLDAMSRAP